MSKLCKRILLILAVFSSFLTLFACSAIQIDTYHVELPQDKYQLRVGQEIEALPIVSKNGQECDLEVSYHSYDASIATYVDGKIVALKSGEVRIKVTLKNNSKVYATALVTVVNDDSLIVDFNYEKTMIKGTTQLLTYELLVEKNRKLTFTSSNENVATIDELGNIKAITVGTTTIETVVSSLYDEGVSKTYKLVIEVKDLTFAINYVLDGGTNSKKNPNEYVPEKLPLLLENPNKSGYKFVGWYDNENFTGESITEISAGTMGDVTLYAKWNALDYRISYELNGGINAENPDGYDVSDLPVSLHAPSRTGYIFKGWYMGENRVLAIPVGTTGNVVVSAKWEPITYTIDFDTNGGLPTLSSIDYTIESDSFTLQEITKVGYTFDGWYNGETKVTEITTGTYGNMTLVAKWTADLYTISYDLADGVNNPENPTSYTIESGLITLKDPTKEGYTFAGWFNGEQLITTIDSNTLENISLTAKWTVNSYKLTFDVDGNLTEKTFKYGESVTAIENPTKVGHTFTGWSEELPVKMPANDLYVSATWRVNSYKLTFDVDGNLTEKTFKYGESVTAIENPTKVGHTFAGWSEELPVKMPANDLYVSATWRVNSYKITFDVDGNLTEKTFKYGETVVAIENPTKVGHTFAGWSEELPETMPANDITVEATWTVNSYKLTFDVDGNLTEKTFKYGESVTAIENPTKVGYTFAGWSPVLPETMPAEDLTVKATWTVNSYDITYDFAGGEFKNVDYLNTPLHKFAITDYLTYQAVTGAEVALIKNTPAKFWVYILLKNTNNDGLYEIVQIADGSANVTAEYDYVIAWHSGLTDASAKNILQKMLASSSSYIGGYVKLSNVPSSKTADCNITAEVYKASDIVINDPLKTSYTIEDSVELPTPSRTGYVFDGWYVNGTKLENIALGSTGNLNLVANWSIVNYNINYDLDNGSMEMVDYINNPLHTFTISDYLTFAAATGYKNALVDNAGGRWWAYVVLQKTAVPGLYKVVQMANGSTKITEQYDILITWHSALKDTAAKAILNNMLNNSAAYVGSYIKVSNVPAGMTADCNITAEVYSAESVKFNVITSYTVLDTVTLPVPTRTGYTFVGWYNGDIKVDKIEAGTTGNLNFVARWKENVKVYHKLELDLAGGTLDDAPTQYLEGEEFILPIPTRENYTFLGWYSGDTKIEKISATETSDISLVAKWEIYPIRVNDKYYLTLKDAYDNASDNDVIYVGAGTFDLDFVIAKSVEIIGKSASETTIKVAADYINKVNAENIVISDVTLKGVGANVGGIYFQPGTKAHYFTVKNSVITDMNTFYKSIAAMSNNVVVTLENNEITKVGQFLIWVTTGVDTINLVGNKIDAANCGTITNAAAALLRIRDGKALVYNNEFTGTVPVITGLFEAGTATAEYVDVRFNTFKNVTKFVYINSVPKSVNFDENLYLDADGNVLTAVPSQVTGNGVTPDATIATSEEERAEFYYIFLHTQALNLVLNGGNCENLPTTYVEGRVTTLPIPSKVGYTFLGWYNGETKVDSIAASVSGELTLEAKWTINSYDITYELAGGVNDSENPASYTIESGLITLKDPTREGYTFLGWYNGEQLVTTIDSNTLENITLTAKWKITTDHEGTEDDPYSVDDALKIAGTLTKGNSTTDKCYIKGIVSEITELSTSYGNATFKITVDGKTILVFRAKNEGNQNFTSTDDLYVGDEVVIYGNITNYNGTLEITNCYVVSNNKVARPEPIEEPEVVDKTLQEIIDMDDATNKEASYKITVIVLGWGKSLTSYDAAANKYGNMIVSDLEGLNKIVVFGATATISALVWDSTNGKYTYTNKQDFLTNAITKSINIGDTLELVVIRDSYNGNTQLNAIVTKVTPKPAVTSNLIFDLDGGICADLPTSYEEGTELSLPTPTKEGYDFLGWEYNGTIITSITTTMTGDLTLTAKWKESGTTLYFEKVTSVNDITDDGLYLIVYENGEKAYAFNSSLATLDATNNYKELALTALGIAVDDASNSVTFRITKNTDGTFAILSASNNYIYYSGSKNGLNQTSTKNTAINNISIDTDGYILITSSSSTLKFNETSNQMRFRYYSSGQSSISLYKYSTTTSDPSKTHNINYNLPEGATNSNPTSYTEGETITLVDPVLPGYTFEGWYDNAECTGTKITEISGYTTDIILYAKFAKLPTHSISYKYNVDSTDIINDNPTEYAEGDSTVLKDAKLTNYAFSGWYLDSEYTNKITAIDPSWTADVVIYGKFILDTLKETVVATATFSANTNSGKVSNYTNTWSVTCDNVTWTMKNFNNNNNGWPYVRAGSKNNASVAEIITDSTMADSITKVVVTVDKVTARSVNSFKLIVASDANFENVIETVSLNIMTGENTFSCTTPIANCYYKIVIDCKKASSNGIVQISKLEYYTKK